MRLNLTLLEFRSDDYDVIECSGRIPRTVMMVMLENAAAAEN